MTKKLTVMEVYEQVAQKAESIIKDYILYSGDEMKKREAVRKALYQVMALLEQTEEINPSK